VEEIDDIGRRGFEGFIRGGLSGVWEGLYEYFNKKILLHKVKIY